MHLLISLVLPLVSFLIALPVGLAVKSNENGRWNQTIVMALGDALVAGYAARELGVSHRGWNFLTGSDCSYSLQSRMNGSKRPLAPVRGSRPLVRCGASFCPALDILRLEEDEPSLVLTDGLTVAIEDAVIDALGLMIKVLRGRWRHRRFNDPGQPMLLLIFLGIRDLCKASCTDFSLADKYEKRLQLGINSIAEQFPGARVALVALPELTQLWHWRQSHSRKCQAALMECACLNTNIAHRVSLMQTWFDINLRMQRLAINGTIFLSSLSKINILNEDDKLVESWLSEDCFHWSTTGHKYFSQKVYDEFIEIV
jgi:hypothetical protein